MKWLLIGVIILLLLLILLAGYATDWLNGVSKDAATKSPTTSLDASTSDDGTTGGTGTDTATTGTTGTTTTGTNTSGTATNTTGTGTTTNNTSRESSNTSSTTNNNTSTTTNTTTTTSPSSGLLSLYADSSAGDSISDVLNNAALLGVSKDCRNEVLIQVCDFTDGNFTVTTKNLLGTGLVTSVTKDF